MVIAISTVRPLATMWSACMKVSFMARAFSLFKATLTFSHLIKLKFNPKIYANRKPDFSMGKKASKT
jgi:hypothetical protein